LELAITSIGSLKRVPKEGWPSALGRDMVMRCKLKAPHVKKQ